jgi:glycosyltransferase involved in cell wall biosynthesis
MSRADIEHNPPIRASIVWEHQKGGLPANLVTVAISLFNYARFIEECLASIAAQTHPSLDPVIVDDCSTDASSEVARRWLESHGQRFLRASILRHAHNQGLAQARNTAFRYSRVDPVFVVDADNQLYPRAVERLLPYVIDRQYDAAYTQLEFFGEQQSIGYADIWAKRHFRKGNYVDAMALVSKRSWGQVEGYTDIEGGWEDFDFWCKFAEAGMRAIFIPEMLCRYRIHGQSMLRTETTMATQRLIAQMKARHPWLTL